MGNSVQVSERDKKSDKYIEGVLKSNYIKKNLSICEE
jgi:hypothetical protein